MRRRRACSILGLLAAGIASAAPGLIPRIPLREGLTIITAIQQSNGDYESIKQVVSVDESSVRLKYSSEASADSFDRPKESQYVHVSDLPGSEKNLLPMILVSTAVYRTMLRADLQKADHYLRTFLPPPMIPEFIPGTTAIGLSKSVLQDLKTTGKVQITLYSAVVHPMTKADESGLWDARERGTLTRVEPGPVPVPVIVNGTLVNLPAIHAKGQLVLDASDFYLLDDLENPLALRYVIGNDHLTVTKINFPGEVTMVPSGLGQPAGSAPPAGSMEDSLAKSKHVDVYGIYFSFNSDKIRAESEPVLKEIAGVLGKHPDWKLKVDGHTDNIGGAAFNLDLSNRRAAAVKRALVERYHIAPERLATAGYGLSRPKAPNDTLEGRALNRRVELERL